MWSQFCVGLEILFCYAAQIAECDVLSGGHDQEGIYYQGITGMKADMSGARVTPKLLELQQECLARDSSDDDSTSDESSDDEVDLDLIPDFAHLQVPAVPAALREPDTKDLRDPGAVDMKEPDTVGMSQESHAQQAAVADQAGQEGSDSEDSNDSSSTSHSDSDVIELDAKAERKAHKKAVKEANRERRKHKMPKHVKKKKMAKSKKR